MGKRSRSIRTRQLESSAAPSVTGRRRLRSRLLVGLGVIVVVAVIGAAFAAFAINAAQPVYACGSLLDPTQAPSLAPASSAPETLGQSAPDLGRAHVSIGEHVTYDSCPPASGPHYNTPGNGPVAEAFYAPSAGLVPQNWIHNLEHGEMVVLYRCPGGSCDQATVDALRAFDKTIPASPRCKIPNDLVVARFDYMKAPIAALVWDRVLFLDSADTGTLTRFFLAQAEQNAPERKC